MYNGFIGSIGDLIKIGIFKMTKPVITTVSPKTVLNLVENYLLAQRESYKVLEGIYLRKKDAEIFVTIGICKYISVFAHGKTELMLDASKHDNMKDAEYQAKNFIEQIYEVLDEVSKRK